VNEKFRHTSKIQTNIQEILSN